MSRDPIMDVLGDIRRLAALVATGLDDTPDATLDRYAAMIRRHIDAPVSLVALVDDKHQYFPGASGMEATRQTPLKHSVCQNVVVSGDPLIAEDLRQMHGLLGLEAVEDLGVIAYAGFPLVDATGQVLGSVCVIDDVPHEWTEYEIGTLSDFATVCSSELQLRASVIAAEQRYEELRDRYTQERRDV